MADDQSPIVEILVKYALYEPLTEEESRLLEEWRSRSEGHDALPDQLRDPDWIAEHRRLLKNAPVPIVEIPAPRRIGWRKPVLAVVFMSLVVGGWLLFARRSGGATAIVQGGAPAVFGALLTQEDGRMLVLDTVVVGTEVEAIARKTDNNTISYVGYKGAGVQRLIVSRGPWRILLADGSRVVLNSGSSLDYSSDLRSSRSVLEGEAWFGISRNVSRPLTVGLAGGTEVRVLGTTFDARTIGGESKVILYSGAIRVRKGADSLLLKPGQAAVAGASGLAERPMIDSERMLAWRGRFVEEDAFVFENASLGEMLQEMAAWYGVKVSNPANLQGLPMTGKLPRSLSLEEMLKALGRVEKGPIRLLYHSDTILVLPGRPGG